MKAEIKQLSSLEKIRSADDIPETEINSSYMLAGEVYSYQEILSCDSLCIVKIRVNSPLKKYINLYEVKKAVMDFPAYEHSRDDNYITFEPGLMPDILVPLEEQNGYISIDNSIAAIWVEVCVPRGFQADKYEITIDFCGIEAGIEYNPNKKLFSEKRTMCLNVLPADIPEQKTIYTQWFYADCIADAHNVGIYTEEHWRLIDRYMQAAVKTGVNMILTPVITPMLDTAPDTYRGCTQLVKIKKNGEKYFFDFSRLCRWIELCKKNGIKYYEIAHLFSQWGCRFSPNILIEENGEEKYLFGWNVPADDERYRIFLQMFIPELLEFLRKEGIFDSCYFHISDEPQKKHIEAYKFAKEIVSPLLGNCKIIDALSNFEYYENGIVENPICAIDHIDAFLENKVPSLWAYYCSAQCREVSNRFLSMPSGRNRIIGLQLYKYDIKGFLHWGFNFYNSMLSIFKINPYLTTSAGGNLPSGDAFSVYPGKDRPILSVRALVFKEALQDIEICRLLERYIGREKVIALIEEEAGMKISFSKYPHDNDFTLRCIEKMKIMMRDLIAPDISG